MVLDRDDQMQYEGEEREREDGGSDERSEFIEVLPVVALINQSFDGSTDAVFTENYYSCTLHR